MFYTDLLEGADTFSLQQKLLQRLVSNIASLRKTSAKYQRSLDKELIESEDLSMQNQCGDYVVFDTGPKPNPKMSSRHRGPYRVIAQIKNDVQVQNLITDAVHIYSVHDLEPFYGNADSAFEAACHDYLYLLTLSASDAAKYIFMTNRTEITKVQPGDTVYVDLQYFGGRWYESLGLPDAPTSTYVMEYRYTHRYHDLSYGQRSSRTTRAQNKKE